MVGANQSRRVRSVRLQRKKEASKVTAELSIVPASKGKQIVLVVDDSPATLKLIRKTLAQAGFQVLTAANGKEALQTIEEVRPDLILSDLNMPEMDGITFCKIVHSEKYLAGTPFLVMSSESDRSLMRTLLHYGASAFLVKPFNMNQLVITIEKLLSDYFLTLLKEKERLAEERRLMLASITSLALALEARDPYTRGHSDQVARILIGMSECMGFDPEQIEDIRITGMLHDIGKIGIRDDVLLKPDFLTREEYGDIMRHPEIGADILAPIPSLAHVIPAILGHHERVDGKGYPHGLKGDNIPLRARMTAVADTFDALTSKRPYRNGYPRAKALQIIADGRSSQLCPECVSIFTTWIESQ